MVANEECNAGPGARTYYLKEDRNNFLDNSIHDLNRAIKRCFSALVASFN